MNCVTWCVEYHNYGIYHRTTPVTSVKAVLLDKERISKMAGIWDIRVIEITKIEKERTWQHD